MFKDYVNKLVQNKNVLMFVTAMFFMAGILSYFSDCALSVSLMVTSILVFLNIKKYVKWKYILLWGFVFYFGFFNTSLRIQESDDLSRMAPADFVITGKIVSIPTGNTPGKQKFFFETDDVDGKPIKAKTLVHITAENNDFSNLNIGNSYKINGKLRTPFKASNPSQFDYGKYLRNFKAYTVFYADNAQCELINSKLTPKWKFLQELNNMRNRIIATHSMYLKSPNLEILGGIVFGDDAVAPPDYIKDSFRNSGLLHILAASGMNVAFIYGFWYFILRRLRVPMKFIIVSGMAVVILYTLMTGLGASVVRAALMLLFVLAGKLIDRDSHSISLLAFVASLMLLYNPAYINDVSFQLSFIVTFGLLTTANIVLCKLRESKIPDWLSAELLIPIVSQLWVAPLQMFYFNSISTYSVLANISIMPFLSVISFGGFVSSLISIITPISKFVCMIFDFVLNYCLNALVVISNFYSNLPNSIFETTHPSVIQVVIYYILVLFVTLLFKSGMNKKLVLGVVILIVGLVLSTISLPGKNAEIITFDVQNADAFLIKTPMNKYFMIDTGKSGYNGGKSQAEYIILKYMKDKGIKTLEGLIITHFDNDHSGGAVDIMDKLNPGMVYINSLNNDSYTSKNIYKTLETKKIPYKLATNNEVIYKENQFLLTTYCPNGKNDNDQSIITLLSYNNFQMLFTGDAGIEAYNSVKQYLPKEKIEVFKVGHHGARGVVDNSMLAELRPDVSIISTGRNLFGHPHKITIDTLRNTDIYRTDRNNSIKIVAGDFSYQVLTYDKKYHRYRIFRKYLLTDE